MNIDRKLVLPQAELLYNAKPLHEITTGGSGDSIFEMKSDQHSYILRVTEYNERKKAHIEFESCWTEYLATGMNGIAKPVRSLNDRLYEVTEAGDKAYILCLQEKAQGKIVDISNPDEFNETLFFNLGALMGQMHRLTMNYEGNVSCSEFAWNGPHFWRRNIPLLDEDVQQAEKRFLTKLCNLPMQKDTYGIVHYDIHTDNFLIANQKITLIDFDACQFNWYAADMASAIFFMIQKGVGPQKHLSEKERTDFAETYLIAYLKGYLQTNTISKYFICMFDLFMKYQMIDEYVATQNYWPKKDDHLRQWYLDWHKDRIIHNIPYAHIDYNKVIDSLPNALTT